MIPEGCEARCPACAHRELSGEESKTKKAEWLGHALGKWVHTLEPIRTPRPERRWNYRSKTVLHSHWNGSHWEFGMLKRARTRDQDDEVVAIPGCPVHTESVRKALSIFSAPGALEGSLPLQFLAISGSLLTLVLKSPFQSAECEALSSRIEEIAPALKDAGIEGVFANFNPGAGRRVFSSRGWQHLWGESSGVLLGARHGPQSFQQLISELFEDALEEASSWFSPNAQDLVLDFYSGIGVSISRWKNSGAESIGVELSGEASSFRPDEILQGRVADRIPQLAAKVFSWRSERSGKLSVFTNPPRTGMEPEVISWLGSDGVQPERIAYLSCSAGTLARDLSKLENCAYRVKRIIPYDFFPQTSHVETLALLERDPGIGVSDPDRCERLRRTE